MMMAPILLAIFMAAASSDAMAQAKVQVTLKTVLDKPSRVQVKQSRVEGVYVDFADGRPTVKTSDKGEWRVLLEPGSYKVTANKPGFRLAACQGQGGIAAQMVADECEFTVPYAKEGIVVFTLAGTVVKSSPRSLRALPSMAQLQLDALDDLRKPGFDDRYRALDDCLARGNRCADTQTLVGQVLTDVNQRVAESKYLSAVIQAAANNDIDAATDYLAYRDAVVTKKENDLAAREAERRLNYLIARVAILEVTTEPPESLVTIDAQPLEKIAPGRWRKVFPPAKSADEEHLISVSLTGFKQETVRVPTLRDIQKHSVKLVPCCAISLEGMKRGARYTIEGAATEPYHGASDGRAARIPRPPGRYDVTVERDGCKTQFFPGLELLDEPGRQHVTQSVEVEADPKLSARLTFAPLYPAARLSLTGTRSGCLGGEYRDTGPLPPTKDLETGQYTMEIVSPEHQPARRSLALASSARCAIDLNLRPRSTAVWIHDHTKALVIAGVAAALIGGVALVTAWQLGKDFDDHANVNYYDRVNWLGFVGQGLLGASAVELITTGGVFWYVGRKWKEPLSVRCHSDQRAQ